MATPDGAELRRRFFEQIPGDLRVIVNRVIAAGAPGGVYVAGGVVRDLLLGRPLRDVDLVTEHDARDVARAAAGGRLTTHDRFRTATLALDGHRVDVATARRERYARPGALPEVEAAPIDEDLLRRDFTINAMALRLDGEAALLDPTGGTADVAAGVLRVLHDGSFRDDATRLFRACRYAARLRFTIEPATAEAMRRDARYVAYIGGERLRGELELMIGEDAGGRALELAASFGVLQAVHQSLSWSAQCSHALDVAERYAPRELAGFALQAHAASREDAEAIVERLMLTRGQSAAVRGMAAVGGAAATLERPDAKPSGVVVVLDRVPVAAVAAYASLHAGAIAGQLASRYLDEWRHVKPILTGADLQTLGVPAGPQIERGLQLIRASRLDGWAGDRGDEEALVRRFAKSIRDSRAMTSPLVMDPDERRN
jgi:tRNA nucleotidyltransferase (CCA-adding enzyme)